jgi:gamma-glutamyl hercynylcysteine S-oxide synthase
MKKTLVCLLMISSFSTAYPQLQSILLDKPNTITINAFIQNRKEIQLPYGLPLFSVLIDSNFYTSFCTKPVFSGDQITQILADTIRVVIRKEKKFQPGVKYTVRFENPGLAGHKIENLVPLGEGTDKVYITAGGSKAWPQYLCRSLLFRPGFGPIGVILPDNAWHLGFADFQVNDSVSLVALARRGDRDTDGSGIDRWAVTLKPGGWVEYSIYLDTHSGDWHTGLKLMFQDRWLYDLPAFDTSLFARKDLQWMRSSYIMLLQFAWDRKYFDYKTNKYTFYKNFNAMDSLTGGFDIFTLWPTWPRLGLDQRNQWDMYRDLPGGLSELKKQADFIHKQGKKYFISYNPWDESSRKEDHLKGMEELLRSVDADGVVLDTRGASSYELQAAADQVKPGIIMYSEGMAIPKDMPGIVAGRVHDALVLPPPLNLNKLIKPDFAIFRVLQLADDWLHRELACAFFNGYGVEINTMRPGRPVWIDEEFEYLGRTSRILRENDAVFHNYGFCPLWPTLADSIYVNRWEGGSKTLYTIYSCRPDGFSGPLFEVPEIKDGSHYVDLWNHVEIVPVKKDGKTLIPVTVAPFDRSWLNTRREGNAGCAVLLPAVLHAALKPDTLEFFSTAGDQIVVTGENPTYHSKSFRFSASGNSIPYWNYFPESMEKIVVQLFDKGALLDERVFYPVHNVPRLISRVSRTPMPPVVAPQGMREIPAGNFGFCTRRDPKSLDPFIPFPDFSDTVMIRIEKFYMDQYPVTNRQFKIFLKRTFYSPRDTTNFLRHWKNGNIPEGQEDMPVVWVSREDILAYAQWAEKRLPTEIEWQYAAQGTDFRKYPWGNTLDSTRCNDNLNHSTSVDAFPGGASPFGVEDLVGNVWEMTNDVYDNGCYYYAIIRGGSYYHPDSSIWYVTGGPVPVDHPEMLLLIGPALDRNATVGFRLVKDSK